MQSAGSCCIKLNKSHLFSILVQGQFNLWRRLYFVKPFVCMFVIAILTGTVLISIDRTMHQFLTVTDLDLITEFDFLPNCARFP